MKKMTQQSQIIMYQTEDGKTRVEVRNELQQDSVIKDFLTTASDNKKYKYISDFDEIIKKLQ